MRTLLTITLFCILSVQAFAQTICTHVNKRHGFSIRYPSDWTVKKAMTKAIIFKAVNTLPDGQFLMLTVNVQLLDRSGYSMLDFSINDITGIAKKIYGPGNATVLDSNRGQINGHPCICLLLDARPLIIDPQIEYSIYVIQNRYYYTVTASCPKPLYAKYAQQLKQLGDSFSFTDSSTATRLSQAPSSVSETDLAPAEQMITEEVGGAQILEQLIGAHIGIAIGALVGALFVQLATNWVCKFKPPYGTAYKAFLLTSLASLIIAFLVGFVGGLIGIYENQKGRPPLIPLTVINLFVGAVIYGSLIKHPESGSIGFGKACLVSIFLLAIGAIIVGAIALSLVLALSVL